MSNPMRVTSFKLPAKLNDALSDLARRRKSSRSALVREALEALTTTEAHSVTAMVDKLDAFVDGPGDLSTNPGHMSGYGK